MMFLVVNDSHSEVEELEVLENYIRYVSKKLDIEEAIFNIILVQFNVFQTSIFLGKGSF